MIKVKVTKFKRYLCHRVTNLSQFWFKASCFRLNDNFETSATDDLTNDIKSYKAKDVPLLIHVCFTSVLGY